jgi:hypothetical protein
MAAKRKAQAVPLPTVGKPTGKGDIRTRIKELRSVRNSELHHNPSNYRRHPEHQRELIRGLFKEIGYVDCLIARETPEGLQLIDGHLRSEESAPDAMLPVLIVDLDDAEVDKVLATLDPVSALAVNDAKAQRDLLARIETQNAAIRRLLTDQLEESDEGLPEVTDEDTKRDIPGMHLEPHEHYDYLVVLCSTTQEWNVLCDKLKLQQDDRRGRMGTCRAMRAWQLLEALGVEPAHDS